MFLAVLCSILRHTPFYKSKKADAAIWSLKRVNKVCDCDDDHHSHSHDHDDYDEAGNEEVEKEEV